MSTSSQTTLSPYQWQLEYLRGNAEIAKWYAGAPLDIVPGIAARPTGSFDPLTDTELAEWLELLRQTGAPAAALDRLEDFKNADVLTVVTGQQAGAALGPLYVIYKALAAIHWARKVQEETGRPTVPVFWVASDDHDIEEIANVTWLSRDESLVSHSLAVGSNSGHPAALEKLSQEQVERFLSEALPESVHETEFLPGLIEDLKIAFADNATFEDQFLRLFNRWIAPLGIVPVVPRLGFLRRRAAGILREEIASREANNLVIAAGEELEKAGLPTPLHRRGDEVNFFVEIEGVRGKVSREGSDFVVTHPFEKTNELARFSAEELNNLLDAEPEKFSPNVITRPLVQDAVFPNVAYIPGPGEFAYHGQLGGLYEHFDVPRPVLLPRPNVALLEPGTERSLQKLGLEITDAEVAGASALDEKLRAAAVSDEDVLKILQDEIQSLGSRIEDLSKVLGDVQRDTAISKALEKLLGNFKTNSEHLEKRTEHFLSVQNEGKAKAQDRVRNTLFPGVTPQERAIGPLAPLFMRHGVEVLGKLLEEIDFSRAGFQAVRLK